MSIATIYFYKNQQKNFKNNKQIKIYGLCQQVWSPTDDCFTDLLIGDAAILVFLILV